MVSPWDWGTQNGSEYLNLSRLGASVHFRSRNERKPQFVARQLQKLLSKLQNPGDEFHFLRSWSPDVVVVSDPGTYHMVGSPGLVQFLTGLDVPTVTISQFNDENSAITPNLFSKARQFFAQVKTSVFVSQRNLDVARRQLCLDLDQAVVLDNPPNLERLDPEAFPETKVIAMAIVARLECAVKGQALVLDILSRPTWRRREWTLNIYGRGPDEAYLRELVKFYNLHSRVQMHGYAQNVREVWKNNEVLLLCSTGEGKPLALTEALICGRTAVVTDVGGNAELVQEGITGFVAENATLQSFESAMERAWAARGSWNSMGARAHSIMLRRLTPSPEERLLSLILDASKDRSRGDLQPRSRVLYGISD